ncbi:hypothetical protein APP_17850 [Aeribacillus pallidus]|nr:hypothetical protein APP_17850 [Aeribacillus pallidus]
MGCLISQFSTLRFPFKRLVSFVGSSREIPLKNGLKTPTFIPFSFNTAASPQAIIVFPTPVSVPVTKNLSFDHIQLFSD